ncbi:SufD family Fe-S cluster assembly protein [Ruminococcaceae bacterium OttesenSCG-928-L11]|nr:SufD family Fe-S cluster assembly protein [Ruminococcaceae bacterium OttesenSCG-928-L11]
MMNPDEIKVLETIAGLSGFPEGAFNIRVNGGSAGRSSTANVKIEPKALGSGIDIHVAPGATETVHIPVVISESGVVETVYNDFYIGEGADVVIVAGCGIHNCGANLSQHDGVHSFHIEKDARVVYSEKHYGDGDGTGGRVLNPVTNVFMQPGSYMEMDTVQIEGVDSTKRVTNADLADGAVLVVKEKLMTHGEQYAETFFEVNLNGEDSSCNLISRSVAKEQSKQLFLSKISGNNKCMGHSECDAIIMDDASVKAVPEITANHVDAGLIHEAAIGKIAGEQIMKLMTLGLTEAEAEAQIINGFLK